VFASLAFIGLQFGLGNPAAAATGSFVQYTYSGSAGARTYYVYTPAGYTTSQRVPAIVMLHGCGGSPVDFSNTTQMNALANTNQFVVVYPQQSDYSQCSVHSPGTPVARVREPAIIAGITQTVLSDTTHWNIDPGRVYIAGFSARAAMSVVLAATYPDVYAAMGEAAGLEYKASTSGSSSPAIQVGGRQPAAAAPHLHDRVHRHAASVRAGRQHGRSARGRHSRRRQWTADGDARQPIRSGDLDPPPISAPAGGSVTITIDRRAGYNAALSGLFLN